MIKVEDYNIAYVRNPKCASTSIMRWLKSLPGKIDNLRSDKHDQHGNIPDTLKYNNLKREDLGFVFTTVRNPWIREYSNYHMLSSRPYANPKQVEMINQSKDFNHFIELVDGNSFKYSYDSKSPEPQSYWTRQCDLVIKIEELDKEFSKIQNMAKVTRELSFHNVKANYNPRNYKKIYNQKTIDIVYRANKGDIEKYNYEFPS
jgi:hypothetical protein